MVMAGVLSLGRGRTRKVVERRRSRKAARQARAASRHAAPELSAMVDRTRPVISSRTRLSFISPHPTFSRRHRPGAPHLPILNPATDKGVGAGPDSLAGPCYRSFWATSGAPHLHMLTPATDRGGKMADGRTGRRRPLVMGGISKPIRARREGAAWFGGDRG